MRKTANLLIGIGAVNLIARGVDYLQHRPRSTPLNELGTILAPQSFWGVLCIITALVIVIGLCVNHMKILVSGCGFAAALYASFVVFQLTHGLTDIRLPVSYMCHATSWAVLCAYTALTRAVIKAREDPQPLGVQT